MDRIGCKRKVCVQAMLFLNMGTGLLGALSSFIILCLSVGSVLAEADLTNGRGEIIHYQANPANTQFPAGNFRISGGDLADWTGATASVSSPERGMVRLKAVNGAAAIHAILKVQPGWKWLTVMARTRPAPGTTLAKNQEAAVSFTPEDASGKAMSSEVTLLENRREGYTNWTSRMRTIPITPGTTCMRVQMSLSPGSGQFDCSEILAIPSQPGDELDHRLVDRFFDEIKSGDEKAVEAMLAEEPRLADSRRGYFDNGTPLVFCAWKELPAMAQILVKHGANLEAVDHGGWRSSPLAWCGWWGSPETAKVLLKAGANPKFKSDFGVTPLSAAQEGKESNAASTASPAAFDEVISLFAAAEK